VRNQSNVLQRAIAKQQETKKRELIVAREPQKGSEKSSIRNERLERTV